MRRITNKLKPRGGFAHLIHLLLTFLLPALLFILVRIDFASLGLALIFLSKWRMFSIRFRHWPAFFRANAVDLMVGLSILVFMTQAHTAAWQLVWAASYGLWLFFIKPGSNVFMVTLQAVIGQLCGLMALFMAFGDAPLWGLVLGAWFICYFSARHFFASFDEPFSPLFSYTWAYFGGALTWLLGHWLLFYDVIAQPTLLLMVIGFALAGLYYLEESDRLTTLLRRQLIFIMVAVVTIVLVFSDWGDRTL